MRWNPPIVRRGKSMGGITTGSALCGHLRNATSLLQYTCIVQVIIVTVFLIRAAQIRTMPAIRLSH